MNLMKWKLFITALDTGHPFHPFFLSVAHIDQLLSKCLSFSFFFSLRLLDLQLYQPQLQHYKQTSTSLIDWIDATRKKQETLQATKIENIQALNDHINNQKVSDSALLCYQLTCLQCWGSMPMCVKRSDIWHLYVIVFSRPWTQKSKRRGRQ